LEGTTVPTPKIAIRLPRQLIVDLRGLAHRESLKRGYTVTWVRLLAEAGERLVRRHAGPTTAAADG
jgi:hypothetical protein